MRGGCNELTLGWDPCRVLYGVSAGAVWSLMKALNLFSVICSSLESKEQGREGISAWELSSGKENIRQAASTPKHCLRTWCPFKINVSRREIFTRWGERFSFDRIAVKVYAKLRTKKAQNVMFVTLQNILDSVQSWLRHQKFTQNPYSGMSSYPVWGSFLQGGRQRRGKGRKRERLELQAAEPTNLYSPS